jgi:hypothetical protein
MNEEPIPAGAVLVDTPAPLKPIKPLKEEPLPEGAVLVSNEQPLPEGAELQARPGYVIQKSPSGVHFEALDKDAWLAEDAKPFNPGEFVGDVYEGGKQLIGSAVKGSVKAGVSLAKPSMSWDDTKDKVKTAVSAAEGLAQTVKGYGTIASNIGSGVKDWAYTHDEEKDREYQRYLEKEAEKADASTGDTILSGIAKSAGNLTGLDTTGLEKNLKDVDQDIATVAGIVGDPLNYVGFGAGAANKALGLTRAAALAKVEKAISAANKLNDIEKVVELTKAAEAIKNAHKSIAEKATGLGAKAMEKIPSVSQGALWSAGLAAKGVGKGAEAVANVAEKVGPLTQTAVGAGIGYAQGETPGSAVVGAITGRAIGHFGAKAEALRDFGGRMMTGGEATDKIRKAMAIGGKDARSLEQQAYQFGTGEGAQDILLKGAGNTAETIKDRMIGSAIRTGMFFGRDVVDPMAKGAALGGLFGYASDPSQEGIAQGVGAGMVFGLGGHGLERSIIKMAGRDPIVDQKYVDVMRNQLPEMDRQALDASPLGPTEKAMLVETYYKVRKSGKDAEVRFVPSDAVMLEILIKDSGKTREQLAAEIIDPEKGTTALDQLTAASKSNGMFVPPSKGKPMAYINTSRADSGVLSHEGSHVFDVLAPVDKSAANNKLMQFILGTPEIDPNTNAITGYKGGLIKDPELVKYLLEQYDPDGNYPISKLTDDRLRTAIAGEIKADGMDQFSRRALAKNMTLKEYQDWVLKQSPEKLQKFLDETSGGKTGYYDAHASGASVLFKNPDGSRMVNPASLEKAIAEAYQEHAATKEYKTVEDADGGARVALDSTELTNQARTAKDAVKAARKSTDLPTVLAAEAQMKDLTESGIYATVPRTDVERNSIAAKIVAAEKGPEALNGPDAQALLDEALTRVAKREIRFEPGNKPVFVTAREAQKFADSFGQHVFRSLETVGPSVEVGAMQPIKNEKTGEVYYRGRFFDDNQLAALKLIPEEILPQHIKDNLEFINEQARNGYGNVLNLVYQAALKGNKYNAKAERTFRKAVPLSMSVSKAGNFLASTFDVTAFNHVLDKELARPNSRVAAAFEGNSIQ